jgi:hypothetical protein
MKNSVLKDALLSAGVLPTSSLKNEIIAKSSSEKIKVKKQRFALEQIHDAQELTNKGFIVGLDTPNNKGFLNANEAYESNALKKLKQDLPELNFKVLKVSIDDNFWIFACEKVFPKIKKRKGKKPKKQDVITKTRKNKNFKPRELRGKEDKQSYILIQQPPTKALKQEASFKESVVYTNAKFIPNPLLTERKENVTDLLIDDIPSYSPPRNAKRDDHIIIGFDLGTAGTKVVFRVHNKNIAYAIPFLTGGDNSYILPSCLFQTTGTFSLTGGKTKLQGFKLDLIENGSLAINATNYMVAFMALVLRKALDYFFYEFNSLYGESNIDWELNFGIPVESMQDKKLVHLFQKIAISGCQLGLSKSDVTLPQVNKYLDLAELDINKVIEGGDSRFHQLGADMVGVSPEVTAQIKGFIQSRRWDKKKNRMMLIDVGGSTVDASYFVITGTDAEPQHNIYSACVLTKGALVLHQQRISWLREILKRADINDLDIIDYLDNIEELDTWLSKLPESVHDYISSVNFTIKTDMDTFFKNSLGAELSKRVVNEGRKKSGINQEFKDIPLFFCGGASDLNLYKNYASIVNNNNNYAVNFIPQKLCIPSNFIAKGLNNNDFHRLSVAFGLSHDIDELTSIVLPKDIPYIATSVIHNKKAVEFIDKDMC